MKEQLRIAIASTLPGIEPREVKVQYCEMVQDRRLDASARLHAARLLNQFFSNVLVRYSIETPASKKDLVSQEALEDSATALPVALNNAFQSSQSTSNLRAESAEAISANYVEYDDNGNLITTTSTTSTTLEQSTLAADSTTNTAAMAGIVAGIIFCVLFICFIIAIVCYMLSHRNSEPNLNQGNQNQPGTDQSESEGEPQSTADIVAGAQDGSLRPVHIREFQV